MESDEDDTGLTLEFLSANTNKSTYASLRTCDAHFQCC